MRGAGLLKPIPLPSPNHSGEQEEQSHGDGAERVRSMIEMHSDPGVEQPDARADIPEPIVANLRGSGPQAGSLESFSMKIYCRLALRLRSLLL